LINFAENLYVGAKSVCRGRAVSQIHLS